jgi:hypothetical protein
VIPAASSHHRHRHRPCNPPRLFIQPVVLSFLFLFCLSRWRYLVITCAGRLIYTHSHSNFFASFLLELSQQNY